MKHESDDELIRRAEMIYRIMNFIFHHRSDQGPYSRNQFCEFTKTDAAPCSEILELGLAQGWLTQSGDSITITSYAFEYEQAYWGTFR